MTSKEIANGILRAVAIIVLVVLGLYTLYLLQSIIVYLIVSLVLTLTSYLFLPQKTEDKE